MTKLQWLIYLAGLLIFAAVCLSFAWGYRKGKKSRKIGLSELGSPEMFAYLLKHERYRHTQDIEKMDKELAEMATMGIYPPDSPVGYYIEVEK